MGKRGAQKSNCNELFNNKKITLNYEEKEILDNLIIYRINTKSLFEDEKLITINRATDKIFKIIADIIDRKLEKLIIIIDSDNLEKNPNLDLFEKDKNRICIPVYPDTNQTLSKIASQYLNKKYFYFSIDLNFIVNKCNGDRKFYS